MAAAERAVTEIVFDAAPAEDGARRVERAGKAIIDANRSISAEAGKSAKEQTVAYERSARATEMAAGAMRAAQSAIQTTANVASAAAQSTMALARSHDTISAAINIARRNYVGLATDAAELSEKQSAAASTTNALTRALTALGLAVSVRGYVDYVDQMSLLNARIGLVTKSTNEFLTAQRAVYTVAQSTAQPIQEIGNLYTKVAEALTPLGRNQAEALRMTETISKAMRVGGGAAASQQAALVQLGQAFSAGALRGEELNSVIEGSPRLARAIAEGMGIARGELKKYAEEGKITSEALANAMRNQGDVIAQEFARLPTTVSAEMTKLNNAVMVAMSQLDKSAGVSGTIGKLISDLTAKLQDQKFLEQVGAILNRLGAYARVAADGIGFLLDNLNGAMVAFVVFSGGKGVLLAISAMNTFRLGTDALTMSLGKLGVASTATQRTIAGLGATFALTNPLSAAMAILSAVGVAYLALADHSDAAGRAVEASNKSIDATRATNADAARSLEDLAAGYGKADAAARALEKTNLGTAVRDAQEAINAQQGAVRDAMNDLGGSGAMRRGDLLAAGATVEQIKAIGGAIRDFKNEVNPTAESFSNLHLQLKTFADSIGFTNEPFEKLLSQLASSAGAAGAAQERMDKANLALQVLANVTAGATGPTAGLSAEQMKLAERLGMVGQAATTAAGNVAEAVASMSKSLSATGGDLSREIERASAQLAAAQGGGIRAVENLRREQSAADEAQRRWAAARQDLAKDTRANIPEQMSDALKSDNMTIRLEAQKLEGQVKTLADTRNKVDAQLDKLRKSATSTKTEAGQIAKNEKLVDTLQAEFDAREKSERAMAVEAATRRLNAKATEDERKEVEALAGSLYDLKAARDQDARLAQANVRKSTIGMTDEARDRVLENTRIASEATRRYGDVVAGSAEAAKKQAWIDKERVISDAEASAAAAEKFFKDVGGISKDISRDVSENLYDSLMDPSKATSAVDFFKSIFKRIAVQALETQIVMPIVTSVVGSAPGLFGISTPTGSAANQNAANQNGGVSGALGGNSNLLSLGSKLIPNSWTSGITNSIDAWGYSALGIGGPASVMPTTVVTGANGMLAGGGGQSIVAGQTASGTTGLTGLAGGIGAGAAAGGIVGGLAGTATNSKAVGGLSGAAAGGLATYMMMGSAFGPLGIAAGAIVGAIMGMIGTQKASVGPNAAGNLYVDSSGAKSGPSAGDNGMDGSGMKTLTDGVSQAVNTIVSGVGGSFTKGLAEQNFANVKFFEKDGKWTLQNMTGGDTVGDKQQFDSQEAMIQALIRQTLTRLDQGGQVTGFNADVRTALTNSKATKAEDLANDVVFAGGFRDQLALLNDNLDPTNNQIKAFTENAKKIGEQVKTNIIDWHDKALELGLATEGQLVPAMKKGLMAMMGLGPAAEPLIGMAAVTKQATIEFEQYKPALESLGYSTAEVAGLAIQYTEKAQKAYQDSVAYVQRQGAAAINGLTDPTSKTSALDRLQGTGVDPANKAVQGLATVIGNVEAAARAGTLTMADERWALGQLNAQYDAGQISAEQYTTAVGYLTQAWDDSASAAQKAAEKVQASEDLTVRALRGMGLTDQADDYARGLQHARDYQTAVTAGFDATYQAGLKFVQWLENVAVTAERVAKADNARADIFTRAVSASGNSVWAATLRFDTDAAQQRQTAWNNGLRGQDLTNLDAVLAAERGETVFKAAQQSVLDWYDREIAAKSELVTSIQDGALKIAQAAKQFQQAADSIRLSEDAPISPQERLTEAKRQWDAALGTINSTTASESDKDTARSALSSLGQTLVSIEKANSAGTADALYKEVLKTLDGLGDLSALGDGVATAEADLKIAQDSLKELQKGRAEAANYGQRTVGNLEILNATMVAANDNWQKAINGLSSVLTPANTNTGTGGGVVAPDKGGTSAAQQAGKWMTDWFGRYDAYTAKNNAGQLSQDEWQTQGAALFQDKVNAANALPLDPTVWNAFIAAAANGSDSGRTAAWLRQVAHDKGVPGFAVGTMATPPGAVWVGERGPELMWQSGGAAVASSADSLRISGLYETAANDRWAATNVSSFQPPQPARPVSSDNTAAIVAELRRLNAQIVELRKGLHDEEGSAQNQRGVLLTKLIKAVESLKAELADLKPARAA